MQALQHEVCRLCGAAAGERTVLYQKWGHAIAQCRSCGLGSTVVDGSLDTLSLYAGGYFHGAGAGGYADYERSEGVLRAEFCRSLRELIRLGLSDGRLLEVGCAYGFFLLEAERHFECVGIEVAQDAVASCRARGLDVYQGVVNRSLLEGLGCFDAVVLLDVIEHLPDPVETMAILSERLATGGVAMISTGDWGSLSARVFGRHWRLMTPPEHLYFFSRDTLARLLSRCGLRVVDCRSPWKLVPLGLMAHQLLARVGARVALPQGLNAAGLPVNLFDAIRVVAVKD